MDVPISDIERLLLLAALLLWGVLLFGGFIFGKLNEDKTHRIARPFRLSSSFVLVAAGWLWFITAQGTESNSFAFLIAIGMTLGFLGDLFMAEIFPLEDYVIGGMAAFGLGHVAYNIGIVRASAEINWIVPIIWWIVAVVLWYLIVFRGSEKTIIHYIALPYALLLASTAGFATNLTLLDSNFILIAIGAALFLLSDLILAAQLFNNLKFTGIGDVVWLTYGPGQMLIVFGVIIPAIIASLG